MMKSIRGLISNAISKLPSVLLVNLPKVNALVLAHVMNYDAVEDLNTRTSLTKAPRILGIIEPDEILLVRKTKPLKRPARNQDGNKRAGRHEDGVLPLCEQPAPVPCSNGIVHFANRTISKLNDRTGKRNVWAKLLHSPIIATQQFGEGVRLRVPIIVRNPDIISPEFITPLHANRKTASTTYVLGKIDDRNIHAAIARTVGLEVLFRTIR